MAGSKSRATAYSDYYKNNTRQATTDQLYDSDGMHFHISFRPMRSNGSDPEAEAKAEARMKALQRRLRGKKKTNAT